ncbi:hypothetical protein [Shewanella aegiceratis]|uniref:hypothetical protein n=1 Tax=Shewanella aegiceratis TaxID=2864203 RepID=UPI001C65CD70|nr:hypothetical protein [Shewanella aegiceratis]QYJ82010.1 hypothetical protein K0H80_17200 [Shewanella aegiceratis]
MANMNIDAIKKVLKSWINEGFLEGELSVEPEWYVLWHPDELEEFNRDYQLAEYVPGFLTFGCNGGGELLVVNELGEVFYMPCIGMALDTAIKIANSLQEFKDYMQQ